MTSQCHKIHRLFALVVALLAVCAKSQTFAAEKSTAGQLVELAKSSSSALRDAIARTFDSKDLQEGTAWVGHGSDFFFAV